MEAHSVTFSRRTLAAAASRFDGVDLSQAANVLVVTPSSTGFPAGLGTTFIAPATFLLSRNAYRRVAPQVHNSSVLNATSDVPITETTLGILAMMSQVEEGFKRKLELKTGPTPPVLGPSQGTQPTPEVVRDGGPAAINSLPVSASDLAKIERERGDALLRRMTAALEHMSEEQRAELKLKFPELGF